MCLTQVPNTKVVTTSSDSKVGAQGKDMRTMGAIGTAGGSGEVCI
jgi:hypothetical protein